MSETQDKAEKFRQHGSSDRVTVGKDDRGSKQIQRADTCMNNMCVRSQV